MKQVTKEFIERLKTLPEAEQLEEWFKFDFNELDYLNYVKPLVIRRIVEYVKKFTDSNPLKSLREKLGQEKNGKKRRRILEIISYLEFIKKRYEEGDKIARMILVNYGLIKNGEKNEK